MSKIQLFNRSSLQSISLALLGATTVLALQAAPALAVDSPRAEAFRTRILYDRIEEVLTYRAPALRSCSQKLGTAEATSISSAVDSVLKNAPSDERKDKDAVLGLMSLYQKTESLAEDSACQASVATADKKLWTAERKKFVLLENALTGTCGFNNDCKIRIKKMLIDLDPYCVTRTHPHLDGSVEGNLCYAGDRLAAHYSSNGSSPVFKQDLGQAMWGFIAYYAEAIRSAPPGGVVDLFAIFKKAIPQQTRTLDGRRMFFAFLGLLRGSSLSYAGFVDATGDLAWRGSLEDGINPEKAFENYRDVKRRRDYFKAYMQEAESKKIRFAIDGHNVETWNHHEYLSAFLACHFGREGEEEAATLIPIILGLGYESLDFVSHIQEGREWKGGAPRTADDWRRKMKEFSDNLKASRENFRRDVGGHISGAAFGVEFCR